MTPEERAAAATEILFGSGWMTMLPEGAISILQALVIDGPMTRDAIDARLRESARTPDGLAAFAWDPLTPYTDESLAELDDHFDVPAGERTQTAAEVNAEEQAARATLLEQQDEFRASRGLPSDHTLGGALDLMLSCGVLDKRGEEIGLVAVPPLPSEMLPLTAEQRADEDAMRWERLHQDTAQGIIRLFRPDSDDPPDQMTTDLARLARDLDVDTESARAALATLVREGDFSTTVDVETLREHQTFVLAVDWAEFAARRIAIRHAEPDEDADDH